MPHNSFPRARTIIIILLSSLFLLSCCPFQREQGGTGAGESIVNKGSDTLVNLALAWAEAYKDVRPDVSIGVTGGGSGTGIAALINGTTNIANASRKIKQEEVDEAESNGITPVEITVAQDAIAVIVHLDNPVDNLTIDQISDIYSGKINNWSEVGGEDRPIVRLSRETNSGTHVFFLETVIRKGDKNDTTAFSADTLLLPSSEIITAEIRANPNAIGYDGLGYVTEDVKMIGIGVNPEGPFVIPSTQAVINDEYPIARRLFMYTAGEPQDEVLNYVNWILGPEGQSIVPQLGFVPLED
ncbi:MAG: phosphate ABC transporter substrate-binding protein PstS family protein [Anaerolineales bacterium]|nr:phosphate ABC transporter substrate-binding protein PstS family protein [Anaerolineales bacterium]